MSQALSTEEFQDIQRIEGNKKCVDCNEADPVWASLGFGTLICLNCAGFHRSLGVHITLVKSITLDAWEPQFLSVLKAGGNQQFRDYACIYDMSGSSGKFSKFGKYNIPIILYYSEILKAKIEDREVDPYDAEYWSTVLPSSNRSIIQSSGSSKKSEPAKWISDSETNDCMLCNMKFTFSNRRHHCRRCGKVVCGICAPSDNSRPILEWGLKDAVRHCKVCYKSPNIKWEETEKDG